MQVNYIKNILGAQNGMARVPAMACTPNNKRLAVVDHARTVHLFDESGERRDKFVLKSAAGNDANGKTFAVRGMAFSADSVKLAIAQSDGIVFVYKLGIEWGERKSICNKYPAPSPVTCLAWPNSATLGPDTIVYGTQEGKVKIGFNNKSQTLYSHDSPCVSLAASPDGAMLVSGHLDCSIMRYVLDTEDGSSATAATKVCTHTSIPYSLGFGESIAAGGNDCILQFYDKTDAPSRTSPIRNLKTATSHQ